MNVSAQRKIAAKILKVGSSRIFLDPSKSEEITKAITREDVRALIKDGSISVRPEKGTSRFRANKTKAQKKKGCRKDSGSRKGKKTARTPKKEKWIGKVRALRDELRKLKKEGKIERTEYGKLYRQIKGNLFLSRRHLRENIAKK